MSLENLENGTMPLMVPVLVDYPNRLPIVHYVSGKHGYRPLPSRDHSNWSWGRSFFFVYDAFIALGLTMLIHLYVIFTNSIHSVKSEYPTSTIAYKSNSRLMDNRLCYIHILKYIIKENPFTICHFNNIYLKYFKT